MATPFPSLPKISDENLAKWVRHLGHRPRPKLKPVPSAPMLGAFTLTATVSPSPPSQPAKPGSAGDSDSTSPARTRSRGAKLETLGARSHATLAARTSPDGFRQTRSSTRSSTAPGKTAPNAAAAEASPQRSRIGFTSAGTRSRHSTAFFGGASPQQRRIGEASPPAKAPPSAAEEDAAGEPATAAAAGDEGGEDDGPPPPPPLPSKALAFFEEESDGEEYKGAVPSSAEGIRKAGTVMSRGSSEGSPVKKKNTSSVHMRLYTSARTRQDLEAAEQKRAEDEAKRKAAVEDARRKKADEKKRIQEERQVQLQEQKRLKVQRMEKKRIIMANKEAKLTGTPLLDGQALAEALNQQAQEDSSDDGEVDADEEHDQKQDEHKLDTQYEEDFEDEDVIAATNASDDELVATEPIEVQLPPWYPDQVPLETLDAVKGHVSDAMLQAPPRPFVECIGAGKIHIRWELPTPMPLWLMWQVRLRRAGPGPEAAGEEEADEWLVVDMDSGRAKPETSETFTWRDRAFVVQPGLRIWGYCIEDGRKSNLPQFGTIVAHYPGTVVVDFDVYGRQKIPQDWVQFAATAKGAKDMQDEIFALLEGLQRADGEHPAPAKPPVSRLWKRAQKDWWRAASVDSRRRQRSQRQCPLICNQWCDTPDPGDRLAVSCALTVEQDVAAPAAASLRGTPDNSRPGSRASARGAAVGGQAVRSQTPPIVVFDGERPAEAHPEGVVSQTSSRPESRSVGEDAQAQLNKTVYSWWPALRCAADDDDLTAAAADDDDGVEGMDDRPEDLTATVDTPVKFEPWPRVQVIPRAWLNRDSPPAERAAKNACAGQQLLAHYGHEPNRIPSDELEASLMHPPAERLLDATMRLDGLQLAAPPPPALPQLLRSERAVRCEVLRPLISAKEVEVQVRFVANGQTSKIPLLSINELPPSREERLTKRNVERKRIHEWYFVHDPGGAGRFATYACHRIEKGEGEGQLEEGVLLTEGRSVMTKVAADGSALKRAVEAKVVRVGARPTHFEVRFEDIVPAGTQYVVGGTLKAVLEEDGPQRVQQPEIVVHDLPDDFDCVEVQVGVTGGQQLGAVQDTRWSAPSRRCTVQTRNPTLLAPLGPAACPIGVSKAEVRWLCPTSPAAMCYRVRMREVNSAAAGRRTDDAPEDWRIVESNYKGTSRPRLRDDDTGDYWVQQEDGTYAEQVWDFVNALGRTTERDTVLAWSNRIVPLVKDLWVLAYGQCEGQITSTPAAAVVYDLPDDLKVKIQFASPTQELRIGGQVAPEGLQEGQSLLSAEEYRADPQEVPIEWIDAVWIQDGYSFFKGKPSTTCKASQPVRFERKEREAHFSVYLGDESKEVSGLSAEGLALAPFTPERRSSTEYAGDAMLGALTLHGLEPKCDYEICVQALTEDGWTPWTEAALFRMPKTSYEQEELVIERQANALYRSPLLAHAFYKQYSLCVETVQNALTEERYERIRRAFELKAQAAPSAQMRGFLVSMSGPVRMSNRMSGHVARQEIRHAVEKGADVNHRDYSIGRSPLQCACEYFRFGVKIDVVKELLELRAEADLMNDRRETALAIAAERGHAAIVGLLLREHGADATIVNREGRTAYLCARVTPEVSMDERDNLLKVRELLSEHRVPWESFEEQVLGIAEDPAAAAAALLALAFPSVSKPRKSDLFVSDVGTKLGKRIAKIDRLRLYEQIEEAGEVDEEEKQRRGRICGEKLLLPLMQAASTPPMKKECMLVTWYLLYSDVARFVIGDVRARATELLRGHEVSLHRMWKALKILPTMTEIATSYPGGCSREMYNGNPLHQWHAHSDLKWLAQQNVVNAFETLIHNQAFASLEEFCSWIGELNAHLSAVHVDHTVQSGAFDHKRLPPVMWGGVYVQWLLSEADRAAPMFHSIAERLVNEVGGDAVGDTIHYEQAPNKGRARVEKKQKDYASPGLHIIHEALDLMPGCFAKVLRTDMGRTVHEILDDSPDADPGAAIMVLGSISSSSAAEALEVAGSAVERAVEESKARNSACADSPETNLADERQEDLKAIEEALSLLRQISKHHLQEIRALGHPPPRMMLLADAICSLLGLGPGQGKKARSLSERRMQESWQAFAKYASHHLSPSAFVSSFEEFDKDGVGEEVVAHVEPIVKNKDFQPPSTKYRHGQATLEGQFVRPLCMWVRAIHRYARHQAAPAVARHRHSGALGASTNFSASAALPSPSPSSLSSVAGGSDGAAASAAAAAAAADAGRPLVVAVLVLEPDASEELLAQASDRLLAAGADAVVSRRHDRLELGGARELLVDGLATARRSRGLPEEVPPPAGAVSSEKAQLLFDIRKCKTGHTGDLLCAGGLLDLVRGSIVCATEAQVRHVYELAMTFTLKDDGCQVVRIKNGFHTPAVGGYCDLKLFLYIAKDGLDDGVKVYHICELQVHLQAFLDCKQYTHLPYQADRGDFDHS